MWYQSVNDFNRYVVQTGITCITHHWKGKFSGRFKGSCTVDSNGDAFGQDIAIGANKSWNLSEFVELKVVVRGLGSSLGLDEIKLEVVCLGHDFDGGGAGIVLRKFRHKHH